MDSLQRLVRSRDVRHNTARQLEVTTRGVETKRICLDCRRSPDYQRYREDWLSAHPLPKRYCPKQCAARHSVRDAEDSKRWHEDVHVSRNMPPFATLTLTRVCQFCQGRLIEVTS